MRSTILILALLMGLLACPALTARAEQYTTNGRVVHTRVAPVVVHRVLPPFRGIHVYQGRTIRR